MFKNVIALIILFLPISSNSFAQSLNIDETIQYLNKLSFENQYLKQSRCVYSGYYQFSIEKNGMLSIYAISTITCEDAKDKEWELKEKKWLLGKFFIDLIDVENIKDYNSTTSEKEVYIKCQYDDNCITSIDTKEKTTQNNSIIIQTSDRYNKNRLFNALNYLLSTAAEFGYKRDDGKDPFVKYPSKENKLPAQTDGRDVSPSKKLNNPSKEYKIPLKMANGVFTLNANINGISTVFILDSGAGETNISSKTESKLIANGIIDQSNYLSNGLYKLADGSIVECKRVKIPKISVGGKIIYNVIASIGGDNSPNLLGQSFLKKTLKWSIDNSQKLLLLF